jgi:hypothetical protein
VYPPGNSKYNISYIETADLPLQLSPAFLPGDFFYTWKISYAILRPAMLFGWKTDLMAYPGMPGLNLRPFRSSISIGFIYADLSTG